MFKIFEDAMKVWNERGSSSLYGVFLFWLVIVNWKFLFNLFWEDSVKIPGSRAEYAMAQHFFATESLIIDILINFSLYVLPAAIITAIVVLYLPVLVNYVFKESLGFLYARKKIRINHEVELAQYRATKATVKAEAVVKEKKEEQRVRETLTKEQQWEVDAEDVRNNKDDLMAITVARSVIYADAGRFTTNMDWARKDDVEYISPDLLARIDTLGVADIDHDSRRLAVTEKGRFLFRFIEKNNLIQARG